jgi:hypothetical protein
MQTNPTNQNQTKVDGDFDLGLLKNLPEPKELSPDDNNLYRYFIASPYLAGIDDLKDLKRSFFIDEFNKLSTNLKNFLTADATAQTIFTTGESMGLKNGQISQVSEIIRDLILGKVFIKDFPTLISSKLGIDDTKAGEMANKLISKSFGPIIEDVKRIQRSKFPEKIMQLQKEGRPAGLNQPSSMKPENSPRQPQTPPRPQPPMTDIRPNPAPTPQPQQRPEFKIPDLRPFDNAQGRQPLTKEDGNKAQKSLEEELEKVASVIDLRDKSK